MTASGAFQFAQATAIVTGAASGIGEALARGLAVRGSDLVLLDRDEVGLDAVAQAIGRSDPRIEVETVAVDLADQVARERAADQIRQSHPRLDLLINNAGVAMGGRFEQMSLAEFQWVIDVNFTAPVALIHHLLPVLLQNPGSHIANVSSVFGLIAPAGQSAYSASKFALRGFTDSLRAELTHHDIGVTTVFPGGIRTRISESARVSEGMPMADHEVQRLIARKLLTYPPEKAAQRILDGIERRQDRVLVPGTARAIDLLARAMPQRHARLLALLAARAATRTRNSLPAPPDR